MAKIILITGGQRSGKSSYAEKMALSLSDNPVYMATAHIWDDEFRERVLRHQERRGPQWTNIEEEKYISKYDLFGRVVLVDCLTLWSTNFFYEAGDDASVDDVFDNFYYLVTGTHKSGGSALEIAYSIGIPIGILGFYNHFNHSKLREDPTPIHIEMRNYEEETNKAIIQDASREGKIKK